MSDVKRSPKPYRTCQVCQQHILDNQSRVPDWNNGNVRYIHRKCRDKLRAERNDN